MTKVSDFSIAETSDEDSKIVDVILNGEVVSYAEFNLCWVTSNFHVESAKRWDFELVYDCEGEEIAIGFNVS